MLFWILFLFDDEVEFGPFRFNMFPQVDRRGKNMIQANIQGFCGGLEISDISQGLERQ